MDLPIQLDNSKFAGHYDWMSLYGEQGGSPWVSINVPEAAFSGVTFDKVFEKSNIFCTEHVTTVLSYF